jgi:hypothetical protein
MKNPIITRIIPILLLASTALAEGETRKEVIIKRHVEQGGPHFNVQTDRDGPGVEKEKVAYLGVETVPVDRTVSAQLGLPRDTGLVVRRVADGSPAATLLKEHDVLTKLDDQILIDMHQLSVLIRSRKAGDEVKLTVVRGGKETTVKAKLGEREVPVMAGDFGFSGFSTGPGNMFFQQAMPGMPAMGGPEAGDVMRMIGGDRMHWFARPRVHVLKHKGDKGSTVLDLPSGNFVFSDDEGSVELASNDDKRELTVKNKKGEVTFKGPLNTPEDHDKLPPEVTERLKVIGGAELGDDDDDLEVETKMLPPATRTRQELPPGHGAERGLRSL